MRSLLFLTSIVFISQIGCEELAPTSDQKQTAQQEQILQEGTSQVGMPAVKNFRERKLMKDIIELRDQASFSTYTYVWSDMQGKFIFFCDSIGYPIPYATQFTSPQKVERRRHSGEGVAWVVVPQADPGGLFSPSAAEGTWIMCTDPTSKTAKPVYVEPRVTTSPFKLIADPIVKETK